MNSKLMTLAFAGALAMGILAPNALAGSKIGGNAHTQAGNAATASKRLPPQMAQRVSSTAHGPNAVIGKKPSAVSGKTK